MRDSIYAEAGSALRRQRNRHRLVRKTISLFCLVFLFGTTISFSCPATAKTGSPGSDLSTACYGTPGTINRHDNCPGIFSVQKNSDGPAVRAVGVEIVLLSSYEETMKSGRSVVLTAASSYGGEVTWKSSNPRIASVNRNGTVTAKRPGKCTIKAITEGAEAKCRVRVTK